MKTVKRAAKLIGFGAVGLVLMKAVWMSAFLVNGEDLIANATRNDLMKRRAYIVAAVREMQDPQQMHGALPPFFQGEWAVGTYSMLTSALTNMAFLYPETREESLPIIEKMIDTMIENEGFRNFDTGAWRGEEALASLSNSNGHLGYLGHLNLMLAAYHTLGGTKESHLRLFPQVSEALIRKMPIHGTGLGETYPGQVFIADNVAAMASVALYEQSFPRAQPFSKGWAETLSKKYRHKKTGLLVHRLNTDGSVVEGPRGCTLGWNSFYLPFVDAGLAKDQYETMKKVLGRERWGFAGLREYATGSRGGGDIDSGPVIFGLSSSGTGFAIAGARWHRDVAFLKGLLATSELVGCTIQTGGKRRYLLAPLVGEAIVLAMKTATAWDNRFRQPQ